MTKSSKIKLEPNFYLRYYVSKNTNRGYLTLNIFLTNEVKTPGGEFINDKYCIFQPTIKLTSPDSSKIFLNISNITDKKIHELGESEARKHLSTITDCKEFKSVLDPIADEYEKWIKDLEKKRKNWETETRSCLEKKFISGQVNIPKECTDECRSALTRIRDGIQKISTDPVIGESFRFANEVMYENILHSKWIKVNMEKISRNELISEEGPNFDEFEPEWRLFQLAFLLLNIGPTTDPNSPHRKDTDLLWFPTGGGKTEAYYGVIAFVLAFRRLRGMNPKSIEEEMDRYGISIIMRYTYRLLTLQQFHRAATLLCACEYVRMKSPKNQKKFGRHPFLVGLWVGQATTPNLFDQAKKAIQMKRKTPDHNIENADPIQLLNCPWCGRKLNAFNYEFDYPDDVDNLRPKRIRIRCDKKCFFGKPRDPDRVLPVVFVDDDIRNLCPSLLISTVDKFAQISWNWRYSTFFGYVSQYCEEHGYRPGNMSRENSERCSHPRKRKFPNGIEKKIRVVEIDRKLAPPELIIQDELHLIAGPLGTLTGLYETAVDVLCENEKTHAKPKIIASTATTKKSDVQIQNLFDSKSTHIFPPLGYEFGESYFATVLPVNDQHPGKLHVGVCSTSVSGYNVDSRVAACILRKIRHIRENKDDFHFNGKKFEFTDEEIDPYYTLVSYYNTIKNLGAAVRMYEDTIPSYMGTIINTSENRFQIQNNAEKNPSKNLHKEELTGRINAAKIPAILQKIETKLSNESVLDALLCTNMLSVGVDVKRLNVMVINGQPKSTSEYIQASGRIGRNNPGIIVTNYTYIRPRDLSYFENFVQFHSAYHKSVESGTSTPFSGRARDRGLGGIFLALARLTNHVLSLDPKKFDMNNPHVLDIINKIKDQILERVDSIDPSEHDGTQKDIENIIKKWETATNQFRNWGEGEIDLQYRRNPMYNKSSLDTTVYLINSSRDPYDENTFTIPESLREAESEISLYYSKRFQVGNQWVK